MSNSTFIIKIDEFGNTLQDALTSSDINFESGISVSGNLNVSTPSGNFYGLTVNGQPIFQVTSGGNVVFNNPVLVESGNSSSDLTSMVTKQYVDSADTALSGALVSGYLAADLALSGALVSGYLAADLALSGVLHNADLAIISGYQAADTALSGALVSGYNAAIVSYSGTAESRFVNVSGDTMTGPLTLSGTSLLAATSGSSNIGTSGAPFNSVYANNFYDTSSPTSIYELTNKLYVDSAISGVSNKSYVSKLNYEFHNHTSNSSTFTAVGWILFPGTNALGNITKITFIMENATAARAVEARIYNPATAQQVALCSTSATVPTVVTTTGISNLPTGSSVLEIHLRRATGSADTAQAYALSFDL